MKSEKNVARILVERRHDGSAADIEPVTIGLPFGSGMLQEPGMLRLHDSRGRDVALQARAQERWPDGTVRWALLDFQADSAAPSESYSLTWSGAPGVTPARTLRATQGRGEVCVDTGAARFVVRSGSCFPFAQVSIGEQEIVDVLRSRITGEDDRGRTVTSRIDSVDLEEAGPLRVAVLATGKLLRGRHSVADLIVRLHFFAGLTTVRASITVRNPRRASHPGGIWELGDRGSVYFKDLSLTLALNGDERPDVRYSAEPGLPFVSASERLEIYQDSSGGENWASRAHVNRHGRVPISFRGYRLSDSAVERTGLRATPHAVLVTAKASIAVAVRHFWQNSPKSLEAGDRAIVLRFWPRQYADVHELQGGEQKTHVLHIDVGGGECRELPWCRQPSTVRADPSWYASAAAVPYLTPAQKCADPEYLGLIQAAIAGPDSFQRKRELIDEYGWRNFGDLYADHEGSLADGPELLVSHYNNQYDAVGSFAAHFMRTGDERWRELMDDLARHVVDIDTYHTSLDKPAYNHGLFWHTAHYVDAGKSSHRSYPRDPKVSGGGPSNEHNYATGLMLHYLMTGDPLSRETVVDAARWVVAMDDGGLTPFRWLAGGNTGQASQTRSTMYHGPGRGAGYSIRALLDGHRLTGDEMFLTKAEELIRRTIHPFDDLENDELLDRERRWSYTVFLQAIGRYLDYKAECGRLDSMYSYARNCLLHYARWMLPHEFPYLDRPDQLEYPTETWAAQDVRKSEVFDYAARHASGAEREAFLEKADFFWRYVLGTLAGMPTRTTTRPMVLLLGHGLLRDHARRYPDDRAASADAAPERVVPSIGFEPQKARARRRAPWVAAAAVAVSAVAFAAAWWLSL